MSNSYSKVEIDLWLVAIVIACVMFQNAKGTEYDLVDALVFYFLKKAGVQ